MADKPEETAVVTRLKEAAARFRDHEKVREALHDAIVEALREGVRPSEIERLVPYDRQHINRIRKAAGIPARRPATVRPISRDDAI